MGRAYEVRKASIQKTGAIKAKLYSTFAKEIYLAAKSGVPEIDSNINLKRIVDKAKKQQVPNDIIDRAIQKAKGAGGEDYQTVVYEGFGPGASTLIIKCLTDNVNRTVGFVRTAFNKCHKSLGVTNSVSYNYDYLGVRNSSITSKVGLGAIGELFVTNEDSYVMTPSSVGSYMVYVMSNDGKIISVIPEEKHSIYPVICVTNDILFSEGDGTISNPFKVGGIYEK